MRVLFLTRATLYGVYGGDTVQVDATAKYLRRMGAEVDIKLANEKIDYSQYDLLHVFNIIRPADTLAHILKCGKPYVVSTIFVDFNEYQKAHSRGIVKLLSQHMHPDKIEYMKAVARWIKNGEQIQSKEYLYKGHRKAVQAIAMGAACLLPNSENEYRRFVSAYNIAPPYKVIYNGIDPDVFLRDDISTDEKRDETQVLCVARIEGKKNQLNLISALNNTEFQLTLIGKPAPNHQKYFDECKQIAAPNIHFKDFIPQEELVYYYRQSKVHVLASWNETCGLSSMEAAYMGCNLVITDKGDTVEYFGDDAWYCNPDDPHSIYEAVKAASKAPEPQNLKQKIDEVYHWGEAARQTLQVYERVLRKKNSILKSVSYQDNKKA